MRGLAKHYAVTTGMMRRQTGEVVRAVDGVSFDLAAGETLGVVGESGSGKSTLARTLLRLEEPTAGEARYQGKDLFALTPAELLAFRRRMQIVFQDPYASLNPRMTVAQLDRRALDHPSGRAAEGALAGAGRRAARAGRPAARARAPLPASVLGRPAPADRDRARARAASPR